MNRKNYLQSVAAFLIILILNLTLYVPVAYSTINSISVRGSDSIDGFAKTSDVLEFSASVSLPAPAQSAQAGTQPPSTQTPSQITKDHVVLAPSTSFDKCSSKDGETVCTLKYPATGKGTFQSRQIPYTITLYKDAARTQIDSSKSSAFIVDSRVPQLKMSVAKSEYSGQDNIVVDYGITDFGCADAACSNKCSGIKGFEVHTADNTFKQEVALDKTECTYKSTLSIEGKKFKDGKFSLIGKATDALSQASQEASVEFSVDSTAPEIMESSFTIKRKGFALSTYSPFSIGIEVSIDISGSDLDTNSVTGDFTPLNPSVRNAKASCSGKGGLFACKWNIDLNPAIASQAGVTGNAVSETATGTSAGTASSSETSSGTTSTSSTSTKTSSATDTKTTAKNPNSITITASDLLGNKATAAISKTLSLDDKGPAVQSLTVGVVKGDKIFAKPAGNTVTVTLTDTTGILEENVILHIDGTTKAPTKCEKKTSFTCTWQNVAFNSDKATISIEEDTTDILKNPVSEPKKIELIIDSKPPIVNRINVTPVGTLSDTITDIFKVGDKLSIVANVTEENELTAYGDFSRFVDKATKMDGKCEKVEADWQLCRWLTDSVGKEGTGQLKFVFNDVVSNEFPATHELTVLGLDTSSQPDLWENKVDCSPKGTGPGPQASVDRQLGTFVSQRVYCEVKLEPKISGVTTLSISQPECKGGGKKYVEKIETFNRERGSTAPFVKITLKKDAFKINDAELNCSFSIVSRIGDRVTKNPEIESANLSVTFYNLPLGEVSESVQKKIDETKKDIKNLNLYIGTFNKIFAYAKKFCQFFGVIYNTIAAYFTIAVVTKTIAEGTCKSVIGVTYCVPAHAAGTTWCKGQQVVRETAQQSWKKSGNTFCKFVNCQWAPGVLNDWRNFVEKGLNKLPGVEYLPGGKLKYTKGGEFQPAGDVNAFTREPSDKKEPKKPEADAKEAAHEKKETKEPKAQEKKEETQIRELTFMDPNNNLFVAVAFGCIPGIISGIDKFRQIKCLYADCLINAVGKDGLPATVCEDLKKYTTCKYIWGEIFALLPYTAAFDYLIGIIKSALSNPFSAIGAGISAMCFFTCPQIYTAGYTACETVKLFSTMGEVIGNIKNIIQDRFKIRQDYCSRIDLEDEEEEQASTSSSGSSSGGQNNPQNPAPSPNPQPNPAPAPAPSPTPTTNPSPTPNPTPNPI